LNQDEERLIKLSKLDSKLRFEELKMNYENELVNLRSELKEKCKENKRLTESYNMVKRTNDTLKKQLNEKHDKNIQIEREKIALNSRLLNLKVMSIFSIESMKTY
jgi:DNA repair exonuclease SbcCD ATPase subunit